MKTTDLIKNTAYMVLLFGISAFLIFLKIYDTSSEALFSLFVLISSIALINGFSIITIRKKNVFYAVSNIICLALWIYPLYIKTQDFLPNETGIWAFILILAAFLPALANCIYTLFYFIIIDVRKKKAGKRISGTKKILSIISIVATCAGAVLLIVVGVKLGIQIPKNIENVKQDYLSAVNLSKEISKEYTNSDLIIEEVLNKHQLTYDNPEDNYYIIEENETICITIDTSLEEDAGKHQGNVICVSSDSIAMGIPQLFTITLYSGETENIQLLCETE